MKATLPLTLALLLFLAGAAALVLMLSDQRDGPQPSSAADAGAPATETTQIAPETKAAVGADQESAATAPIAAEVPVPVSVDILFAFDEARLRHTETSKLDELARLPIRKDVDRLYAIGHADRIGDYTYNVKLSERRAEAVRAYLQSKGIAAEVVRIEAKGEMNADTGDTCKSLGPEHEQNLKLIECLQPDRRVEITGTGEG
jgi:OmpA-OmpF porin, OOP family